MDCETTVSIFVVLLFERLRYYVVGYVRETYLVT